MSRTPAKRPASGNSRAPDPNDITQGSIPRHLVRLSVPGALTNLLSFSTTFVDIIWLGRISPAAIAAVATFNYFWFLANLLNQLIGQGSVPLIARTYGAGSYGACRRVFGQTFSFKVIVAVIVAALGLTCQRWAFALFGAKDDVLEMAVTYGTVMFAATPIIYSTFTLKTAFRAIGDMHQLMVVSAYTAVLNLVIDPFLIFERVYIGPFPSLGIAEPLFTLPGAGMGVAGAAWGTVLAFSFVFIQSLFIFLTGRTFLTMRLRYFISPNWDTARRIMGIGTPPALANTARHFGDLLIGAAINTYGTSIFAGQGVNLQLQRAIRMAVMGIQMSAMAVIGQNLGARQPRRAMQGAYFTIAFTAVLLLVLGGAMYAFAPQLTRLFIPGHDLDSLAAAEWATRIMRINCFVLLAFGLSQVARAPFEGSGHTRPPFLVAMLTTWGIQIPLTMLGVYLLRFDSPLFIWWMEAGAYLLSTALLLVAIRRGNWLKKEIGV